MEFLILKLRAPLMSFGDVAVDETRPTHFLPTRSMLTGMIANALGWRAREGKRLDALQQRIRFGARRERTGELLVDYQNAHMLPSDMAWRTRTPGPLKRTGGGSTNAQRYCHYIAEGAVTVVLTLADSLVEPTLQEVSEALMRPARPLFLGRKSCLPSVFLHQGESVDAQDLPSALAAVESWCVACEGLAEWDCDGSEVLLNPAALIQQRSDMRDWQNSIHSGRRLVAQGIVTPLDSGKRGR